MEGKILKQILILSGIILLFCGVLGAQTFTAALKGHVYDKDGLAMPGVTIIINSPSEIRTDLTTTCNDRGYYHFATLTPGVYQIKCILEGFAPIIRDGVTLHVGEEAIIDFTLTTLAVEEEVLVTADAPLVEISKSSLGETVDTQTIDNLPLLNRVFFDLIPLAAGAAKDPASGRITAVGDRMRGANIIIDGIDNNDNVANFGQVLVDNYIQDTIQEFEILTTGYNAEYGEASGVVANMITKQGSNDLHGRFFFYHRNDALDASPLEDKEPARLKRYEYGFTLGGPIKKDKLWFYFATQLVSQEEGVEYDFSIIPDELKYDFYGRAESFDAVPKTDDKTFFFKLTGALHPKHRLNSSIMYFPNKKTNWVGDLRSGRPMGGDILPSAGHSVEIPGVQFKANLTSTISENSFLETNIGFLNRDDKNFPNVSETPFEIFPDFSSGRQAEDPREFNSKKFQWSEDFTFYKDNWGGNHKFKSGFRFLNDRQKGYLLIHNFIVYATNSRAIPIMTICYFEKGRGLKYDVTMRSYSFYFQDSWEVKSGLTLNLGARWDRMSPFNHNAYAPRFGLAWDPLKDGKTVIRFNAGRFYDTLSGNGLLLDEEWGGFGYETVIYPGIAPFLPGGQEVPGMPVPPSEIRFIQAPCKTPYADAVSFGIEREIMPDYSISVQYLQRWGRDIYSQRVINWDSENQTTTDGGPKRRAIGYDNYADYKSFQITLQKKFSNNFQFLGNYTWTDWKDCLNDNFNNVPDDDNDISKDYGPGQYSIPHRFMVSGSWRLPYDFMLSGIFVAQSGFPYSAQALYDQDGDGRAERPPEAPERNKFRRPYYGTLDLRVSKSFAISKGTLEFFLEGFNITNKQNVMGVRTNIYDEENFGKPLTYYYGRVMQLAFRYSF